MGSGWLAPARKGSSFRMTNLMVTNVCDMQCAYCFARDYLGDAGERPDAHFISLTAFEERLDFLSRSGINEIRLIGGEPTLHPQFSDLIALARKRNQTIVVFSHGIMKSPALECLCALPAEQCCVLVNVNAMRLTGAESAKEQGFRRAALLRLGLRAMLGFNIFTPNFSLDGLLPIVEDTGCSRRIRLGLAHPALSGQNVFIHPKQYPFVGGKIVRFAQKAAQAGVKLEFDCGFVRCMFSEQEIEALEQANAEFGWHCNPILDIDLGGQAFHCFPLADKVNAPVLAESTAAELRSQMMEQVSLYRLAGIYKECSTCHFKQVNECTGGCLANTLKRFRPATLCVSIPARFLYSPALSEG